MWPDYSVNDYIYRPSDLENISFYQFVMYYVKNAFTFERMKKRGADGLPTLGKDELAFLEGHPGRRYCCLKKSPKQLIPQVSTPSKMICDIEMLELDKPPENVSDAAIEFRESYAKAALLLFFPFRNEEVFDLGEYNNLWEKFTSEMNSESSNFWKGGKKVLQNFQDLAQSSKCKIPEDDLKKQTDIPTVDKEDCTNRANDGMDQIDDFDDAISVKEK